MPCGPRKRPRAKPRRLRKLSDKSVADNRSQWEKFLKWAAAQTPALKFLEDVTAAHALAYSKYLRDVEKLSDNRHNKLIQTASVMFRLAGRVDDPFAEVPRYEVEYESRVNLERNELLAVCQAATGELRTLLAIGLYSGMRLGDCVTLDWDDSVSLPHNRLIRLTTKTRKTVSFPLHPELRAILEETPDSQRHGFVCPDLAALYQKDPSAVSKRVRTHFESAGLKTQDSRGSIVPARQRKKDKKKAGGKKGQEKPRTRGRCVSRRGFHAMRHSFITECARAGVPIGAIRDWIRHQSQKITEIYQHWREDELQGRILQALPAFNGDPAPVHPEPERDRLAEFARSLSIDHVRELLEKAEALGKAHDAEAGQ